MELEISEEEITAHYTGLFKQVSQASVEGLLSRYDYGNMEQISQIEQVLSVQNASHDDVKAVCHLYAGDISISAIIRNRQQWFAYAAVFGLETSCEGLLAAMTRNNTLANLLPDLATLLRIYLTLPSTSCEAERSFSVLRRLKNYLRTTMSQNRLNHLCILSVQEHRRYT